MAGERELAAAFGRLGARRGRDFGTGSEELVVDGPAGDNRTQSERSAHCLEERDRLVGVGHEVWVHARFDDDDLT